MARYSNDGQEFRYSSKMINPQHSASVNSIRFFAHYFNKCTMTFRKSKQKMIKLITMPI